MRGSGILLPPPTAEGSVARGTRACKRALGTGRWGHRIQVGASQEPARLLRPSTIPFWLSGCRHPIPDTPRDAGAQAEAAVLGDAGSLSTGPGRCERGRPCAPPGGQGRGSKLWGPSAFRSPGPGLLARGAQMRSANAPRSPPSLLRPQRRTHSRPPSALPWSGDLAAAGQCPRGGRQPALAAWPRAPAD